MNNEDEGKDREWYFFQKEQASRKESGQVFTKEEIFLIIRKARELKQEKRQLIELSKIIIENNKKIDQLNNTNKFIKEILGLGE